MATPATTSAATIPDLDINDVVITCPAYFGTNEREATRALASCRTQRALCPAQPTVAAIYFGFKQQQSVTDRTVLVYDLGGGTFDITVISIEGADITVICTGGDHQKGGKDWDAALVSFLAEKFMQSIPRPGIPGMIWRSTAS